VDRNCSIEACGRQKRIDIADPGDLVIDKGEKLLQLVGNEQDARAFRGIDERSDGVANTFAALRLASHCSTR